MDVCVVVPHDSTIGNGISFTQIASLPPSIDRSADIFTLGKKEI